MNPSTMNLEQLQRAVFDVVRQPLTEDERMREQTLDGRSTKAIAEEIVKPNDRLTSVERLEIYNRVYWFRLLSSLADDFPGLREVIGQEAFDKVLLGYLTEMPSVSYTLRDLGSRLETWLRAHPEFISSNERMALDMVRLEWADIEAFDAAEYPVLARPNWPAWVKIRSSTCNHISSFSIWRTRWMNFCSKCAKPKIRKLTSPATWS